VSGRHSHNNGVRGNKWPNGGYWTLKNHRNTLPVWLQGAGYRTGFVGKYMNGYASEVPTKELQDAGRRRYEVPPGWNHWYASVERVYSYTSVVLRVKTPKVDRKKVEKNEYQTKVFSDLSDRMIDNFHDSGQRPGNSHRGDHFATVGAGCWRSILCARRRTSVRTSSGSMTSKRNGRPTR